MAMQALVSTREVFDSVPAANGKSMRFPLLLHFSVMAFSDQPRDRLFLLVSVQLMELSSEEANDEEAIRKKEQEILDLGEMYKKEGKARELAELIRNVRPFLTMISKAKAAKLVRSLVDLFLDMEAATGTEVSLCKVCLKGFELGLVFKWSLFLFLGVY